MLIKALCDYADKQEVSVSEEFTQQDVHYDIVLSPEGELLEIVDIKVPEFIKMKNGKEKTVYNPKKVTLPKRTQKTCIDSNYIEHRPYYIFGLAYDKKNQVFSADSDKDKARKSHNAFVKHELEFLDGLNSEICIAYKKFIEKWVPENETENEILQSIKADYDKSYYQFSLGVGKAKLHEDKQLLEKFKSIFNEQNNSSESNEEICGILGEKLPTARIHNKIKFPGGNSVGCQLVCMNDNAFESYGKEQSFNSNVSEVAMKKYSSTFNKLLTDKENNSKEYKHRITIGDMVIIFFAMKSDDSQECTLFSNCASGRDEINEEAENAIRNFIEKVKDGFASKKGDNLEADMDSTFYVVGLTPNSSRICQKFIYRDKFGNLMKNLVQHQIDMQINAENDKPIYFWQLFKELISPKANNEKVSSPLMSSIMLSAFNNTKYPDSLLATVIKRIKVDSDTDDNPFIKLNDRRAGIIKACLNRKYRNEEITMAWNEENQNPAYLCGGLFAVYEKIQKDSVEGTLNRTIKDAYFASACSRPASVLPKLAKLSQVHIRKLADKSQIYYQNLVCDLMSGLNGEFPTTLSLDDQGRFIVGYYQMNKKLYTSSKSEGKE